MTPKLQAMRDELAKENCCWRIKDVEREEHDMNYYKQGFDAAVAELWPSIEFLLVENQESINCAEQHFSANMKKEKKQLQDILINLGLKD